MQLELLPGFTPEDLCELLNAGEWNTIAGRLYFSCPAKLPKNSEPITTTLAVVPKEEPTEVPDERRTSFEKGDVVNGRELKTAGDVLAFLGVKYGAIVAAALKVVDAQKPNGTIGKQFAKTTANVWDSYIKAPGIEDSAATCQPGPAKPLISRSPIAGLHYLFAKLDREAADSFVRRFLTGRNLEANDAVLALREALIQARQRGLSLSLEQKTAVVVLAWNHERENRKLKKFHLEYFDNPCQPIV